MRKNDNGWGSTDSFKENPIIDDECQEEDEDWGADPIFFTKDGTPLYEHFRIMVDPGQTPLRIDKFLVDRMPHTTRNRIQQAADAGFIRVWGNAVKSNYKVKPNDEIILALQRPRKDFEIIPEDIPLNIVFEDEYLMVINKPAGLVVHPGNGNWNGTLVNALAYYLQNDPDYDPSDPRVGLVHRIDKDTSGLLVIAKRPTAKSHLSQQFFNKTTERTYWAVVWGRMEEQEGRIEGNIGRNPKDRLLMACFPPESDLGKPAVTHYKKLEQFAHTTLVECKLETGRTHQIRVHMSHIGHPLFADERYGGMKLLRGNNTQNYRQFIQNCFEICPRQALHAKTLGFIHPHTGESLRFDSELPEDFSSLIEKWQVYTSNLRAI